MKNSDYPEIWAGENERYIGEIDAELVNVLTGRIVDENDQLAQQGFVDNLVAMLKVYQAMPMTSLATMAEVYRRICGESVDQAKASLVEGVKLTREGRLEPAIELFERALLGFERTGDLENRAKCLSNLGSNLCNLGRMNESLERLNEALTLARTTGNVRLIASIEEIQQFVETSNQTRVAFEDSGVTEQVESIATIILQLRSQNKLDEAEQLCQEVATMADRMEKSLTKAQVYSAIGVIAKDRGDLETAIKRYECGIQVYDELGDSHGKAIQLLMIAKVYAMKKDWMGAAGYIDQGMEAATRAGDDALLQAATDQAKRAQDYDD